MPVGVMLRSMSSKELSQWAAFEKLSGPLGQHYSDEMLASLHEQGQMTNYLLGAIYASWTEQSNPVAPPEALTRPNQIFADKPDEEELQEETKPAQAVPTGGDYVPWQSLARQMVLDQQR